LSLTVPGSFAELGVVWIPFPLAPALSRWEKENVSQRWLTSGAYRFVGACLPLLPAPEPSFRNAGFIRQKPALSKLRLPDESGVPILLRFRGARGATSSGSSLPAGGPG